MSSPSVSDLSKAVTVPMCSHPKVKVVARDEDAEYVECSQCGEVFDSSEFRDMQIEDKVKLDEDSE